MRLATRCPSCTTMFLVVEDQLRVSEGWVRCGRCANVFNAVDDLIDVERGNPVQLDLDSLTTPHRSPARGELPEPELVWDADEAASPPGPAPAAPPPEAWSDPGTPAGASTPPTALWLSPAEGAAVSLPPAPMAPPPSPAVEPVYSAPAYAPAPYSAPPPPAEPEPASVWPEESAPERLLRAPSEQFADGDPSELPGRSRASAAPPASAFWPESRLDAESLDPLPSVPPLKPPRAEKAAKGPKSARASKRPKAATTRSAPEASQAEPPAPSFVQQADRAARWSQPRVRTGLGVATGLLLVLGLAQATLLWRDGLAAHLPALAPGLQAVCRAVGCQVQPLRRIDLLAVDSSGLVRADDGQDLNNHRYRLAVQLHNRARTSLMAPAVELTLTDARGDMVSRRVLQMADFGAATGPLAAGQELPLRVLLATGPQPVEGYTVELFYP